jgi:hypothetical protein
MSRRTAKNIRKYKAPSELCNHHVQESVSTCANQCLSRCFAKKSHDEGTCSAILRLAHLPALFQHDTRYVQSSHQEVLCVLGWSEAIVRNALGCQGISNRCFQERFVCRHHASLHLGFAVLLRFPLSERRGGRCGTQTRPPSAVATPLPKTLSEVKVKRLIQAAANPRDRAIFGLDDSTSY